MKPIILIFTAFYLPGYRGGGPIRTIANMVERLGNDFDFHIVTADRDLDDNKSYPDVQVDAWNIVGNAKVFYTSTDTCSLFGFARLMRETPHDLLYLNSFFDTRFTLRPVMARWLGLAPKQPLVIAPRGEFSAGALRIKRWKKKPFIQIARFTRLFAGSTWQASTDGEKNDIYKNFPDAYGSICVARNIAIGGDSLVEAELIPDFESTNSGSLKRVLRICFLSRIAAMKNLDYALEVLLHVTTPIDFKIYGPKEDLIYWNKCEILIKTLPSNIKVSYCGSVDHADVKAVIKASDLFFVPSRGENFGHVFMESLSAGVPILVSDQTPWRDLESNGIGWDIPLDKPEIFVKVIEHVAQQNYEQMRTIRQNCVKFAKLKTDDPFTIENNRALFLAALG